jgi:trimethylamine--corrinoid protein Co-methyltransferase
MSRATLSIWNEDECRQVHEATLGVLEKTGVEVRHEPALEVLAGIGARVEKNRVRFDASLVEHALAACPRSCVLKSRGDGKALDIHDGATYFGTGSDCLYVRDPDTGERRRAVLADVEGMASVCERLPNIDFVMSMGSPTDVRMVVDDLASVAAMLAGTHKPLMVAPRDGDVLEAMLEMATLAGAGDSLSIYAMPSPPLMHDRDAVTKIFRCAELGIPLVYAPAPNAGASAPRTVTATVIVGNAEVLSGLVLHQAIRPGAPFIYGAGMGAMDMHTSTNPYCSPDTFMGHQAACDLAHYYGLPSFAYAAVSDSKLLDEQLAAEAALTTVVGALSRATLLHDVGYLEMGMQSSYESIVLGDELVGWAKAFMRDVGVDSESMALDEIHEVGPGGNHLGRPMTRRRYREFWQPTVLDRSRFDQWQAEGGRSLGDRVGEKVRLLRAEECAPVLADGVRESLNEVVDSVVSRGE